MRSFKTTTHTAFGVRRALSNAVSSLRGRALLACILPASALLVAAASPSLSAHSKGGSGASGKNVVGKTPGGATTPSAQAGFAHDVLTHAAKILRSCHTGKAAQAGIDLAHYKTAAAYSKTVTTWDRVAQAGSFRAHAADRTARANESAARYARLLGAGHNDAAADCKLNDPGHVTLRRLNRAEYNNTVRDLCGVDIHPADEFPNDDVGYGFDNIGDVLSISPLLMEKYVTAAEQVAHAAFENPDNFLKPEQFHVHAPDLYQPEQQRGRPASLHDDRFRGGRRLHIPRKRRLHAARHRLAGSGRPGSRQNADCSWTARR